MAGACSDEECTHTITEEEKKIYEQWPWVYIPHEWEPVEIQKLYKDLTADDEKLTELDFAGELETRVEHFLYAKTDQQLRKIPADSPDGEPNIKVECTERSCKIHLPNFISELAPRRLIEDACVNPIPSENVRYACIAPYQSEAGYVIVLLSVWIKPPEGYISEAGKIERELNNQHKIDTSARVEEWKIAHLYLAMKSAEDAWLFVNAVGKLVYESFGKLVWRVNRMRPLLTGFLRVAEITRTIRDKIDEERLEMEDTSDDSDESDSDDDIINPHLTEEERAAEAAEKASRPKVLKKKELIALEQSPTEQRMLNLQERYAIIDEEHLGLYETPYCQQALYELRFYENPTYPNVVIDLMYACKKSNQFEIEQDDKVYIVRGADRDPECFKKLCKYMFNRVIRSKPKQIFTDSDAYFKYHDSFELHINTPEDLKNYQRKVLEQLNAENKTFEESLKEGLPKNPRPPAPPHPGEPLPEGSKNWISCIIAGSSLPDDEAVAMQWIDTVEPALNGIITTSIEALPLADKLDEEGIKRVLRDIRGYLQSQKYKAAIGNLKGLREICGNHLFAAVKGVSDIELLMRIFFLPDKDKDKEKGKK